MSDDDFWDNVMWLWVYIAAAISVCTALTLG